jgi:hypothetical protein
MESEVQQDKIRTEIANNDDQNLSHTEAMSKVKKGLADIIQV